jgi:uncharacterized protein YyaL (SSP411 family)
MTNRLVDSPSLYLRKHAENPIDWWPWCAQALQTALREDKPIFLSIGYSSCHWCTVMEGEAFSDPTIADYMNANFLPIKVDREERPDLDSIYMQALQMLTGQGGWPLNVVLAPGNLTPFYGGTYFPIEPKFGRPGFLRILTALREFYDRDKAKLNEITGEVRQHLQQGTLLPARETPQEDLLKTGLGACGRILIPSGYGTCFPMIPYAEAALRGISLRQRREANPADIEAAPLDYQQISLQRGLDLVLGGIYDHVGGGFHRYTVDPTWTVPHFEKMLYDNGQIMEYLASLWQLGLQPPACDQAITGTVRWLQREMIAEGGYFYAAQDADSFVEPDMAEPEEGAFYVWRFTDLENWLSTEELAALQEYFSVTATGNFEGQNVLQRTQAEALPAAAHTALEKLFVQRYGAPPAAVATFPAAQNGQQAKTQPWPGRIPPVTDTKMIVAWNSLMISGLAKAAMALGRPAYLAIARTAAVFIQQYQRVDGRLHRLNYDGQPHGLAQSEDYAFWIKAMLDLQQAQLVLQVTEAKTDWLQIAIETQQEFDEWLWSHDRGGYYNTASDSSETLLVRERSYQDNATPSANGVAIANLVRLSLLTEELTYLDRAEQALKSFGTAMEEIPRACPSLFSALDWFLHGTAVRTRADRLAPLAQAFLPTTVFIVINELPSQAIGIACRGTTCLEPATSMEQLLAQLQSSSG